MALCPAEGRPDMYGLGIRLAFYIVWATAAFFEFVHEEDLPDLRLLGFSLSLAVTIGLAVQISKHTLQPIDIDISLILSMGIYVFLIPVYSWRVITCFNRYLDPLRHTTEAESTPVFKLARLLLLLVITGIGIWFFTTYLVDLQLGCEQYAFFLSKMKIEDKIYVAFGSIFFIAVVITCIVVLAFQTGWARSMFAYERPRRSRRRLYQMAINQYRLIGTLSILGLLVAAIELPIRWNKLRKVNELDTSAQLIPLVLVIIFVARVFGRHFLYHRNGDDDDDDDDEGGDGAAPQVAPEGQPPPNMAMENPAFENIRWSHYMPQTPISAAFMKHR